MMTIIEVAATLVSLTAAANMTLGQSHKVWISMLLWTIGSILWLTVGISIGNTALIITNIGFFLLEAYGLIKWWRIKHDR